MSTNDKREWRKIVRSMPREVQAAIDAHAQLHQPDGEVTVAKPRPGSSSYGWWLVELLPEQRAVLFRPDDPRSPVIWGVYIEGPEWLLARVEDDRRELVGGRVYDLGGRLERELTVEEYTRAYSKAETSMVVMRWRDDRNPPKKEFDTVLEWCLRSPGVPTKEQLDQMLTAIRVANATPAEMRSEYRRAEPSRR